MRDTPNNNRRGYLKPFFACWMLLLSSKQHLINFSAIYMRYVVYRYDPFPPAGGISYFYRQYFFLLAAFTLYIK